MPMAASAVLRAFAGLANLADEGLRGSPRALSRPDDDVVV